MCLKIDSVTKIFGELSTIQDSWVSTSGRLSHRNAFSLYTRFIYYYYFYATEMYIMHFLEPSGFLNAPDLAGRKVHLLYAPQNARRKGNFT